MLTRRDILTVGTTLAGASCIPTTTIARISRNTRRTRAVLHQYPPFELQAARPALLALKDSIAEYAVERVGKNASLIWVRNRAGQVWAIGLDQRDLQFKFEVFAIAVETIEAMQARVAAWTPPQLPADIPENLRQLLMRRPEPPKPSSAFQPWPFASWKLEVLRRAEYVVENVETGPTFGNNPNMQAAGRPGKVPPEASASCDVAVGLLFTGEAEKRLLVGVDWMPFNIIITEDAHEIDEYLGPCERIAATNYASRLPTTA